MVGALGLLGAATRRARALPLFVWLTPVALVAAFVFIVTEPRYREPIEPFVVVLAASGVVAARDRLRRDRARA